MGVASAGQEKGRQWIMEVLGIGETLKVTISPLSFVPLQSRELQWETWGGDKAMKAVSKVQSSMQL